MGFGDTVVIGFPVHPTLADIAQRDREIAHCRAMDVGGHRLAGRLTVGLAVAAAAAGITASLIWSSGGSGLPLLMLAILLAAMAAYCGRIWWIDPPIPTPDPLHIEPYSPAENRLLIGSQPWEPFWTYSTCPGCGHVDAQTIRPTCIGEPSWASVVRRCAVCDREWAQG